MGAFEVWQGNERLPHVRSCVGVTLSVGRRKTATFAIKCALEPSARAVPYNEPPALPRPVDETIADVELAFAFSRAAAGHRAGAAARAERDAALERARAALARVAETPPHRGGGYARYAALAAPRTMARHLFLR